MGQTMADIVSLNTKGEAALDRRISVAERSVLSQNFVIGEEKSEKSLLGSQNS